MSVLFKDVRKETIYVELLNEGTCVWRPAPALQVGPQLFVLLPTQDYDPETEEWKFLPGSVVVCERRTTYQGDVLVASSRADI